MKYNTIIMLAMGIELSENGKYDFEKDGLKIKYNITGDPEFRFKAAKKLYASETKKFILVGGSVKNAEAISKPDVMEDLLVKKYGIPKSCMVKLVSEANTAGNAKAVKEYIIKNKIDDDPGLLTNYYHMVRALRDFADIREKRFIPIVAEGQIYDECFDEIRKFYETNTIGLKKIIGESKDQSSEIKGLHDIESEKYKSGIS